MASSSHQTYTVVRDGMRKIKILAPNSSLALYTGYIPIFPFSKHTLTMYEGESTVGPIVGACRIPSIYADIKLAFGDPDENKNNNNNSPGSSKVVWEDLRHRATFRWTREYHLSVELPPGSGKRRDFTWKTTHAVQGLARKWDTRHIKLVDDLTGRVVARFVHAAYSRTKLGVFEVWEVVGQDAKEWHRIVFLSALALLEFKRRRDGTGR